MGGIAFYPPPFNVAIKGPDLRFLEISIKYVDKEYWCAGSRQTWLVVQNTSKDTQLTLTFDFTHGFCLEFEANYEPKYIALGGGALEHTVTARVGGDPWLLPTKFFVNRGATWQAVEEFCKTGARTNRISWGTGEQIKWHYGYNEDD